MAIFVSESQELHIPTWVVDLPSFRKWADDDDFPDDVRIWFLKGEVFADVSKEQIFSHSLPKGEITHVLTGVVKTRNLGWFFPDGVFLSNPFADFGGKPDGMYVSRESVKSGRVELIKGKDNGFVEVVGTPDMVLEVVSTSSVKKDKIVLKSDYWEADIKEYWLVDARQEPLELNIFRHGRKGYIAVRCINGWLKSVAFGKSFQLKRSQDEDGYPRFELLVK